MNGKPSAPASAKGQEVDLSTPNLSATALRDCHRRHLEKELGSKHAVQPAYANGAPSITLEQALDRSLSHPAVIKRHPFPLR